MARCAIAEIGLGDLSILAHHNRPVGGPRLGCYGDLHATMASGRMRLATEGGAKIAR
jgi:hypothetical protein